jgi:hypothetical protein
MPKVQENQEFQRELIPAWSHFVRLVSIIDLGTQKVVRGEQEKEQRKIMLTFELPDETYEYETKEGEKKNGVKLKSNQFTLSWSDKSSLRNFIETRQGVQTLWEEGLDVSVWLGKSGIGTIQHNSSNWKTYDNLEAVAPLMKWMEEKKQVTESLYFDLDNFDAKLFDKLPQWIQDKIRLSPEYLAVAGNEPEWIVDELLAEVPATESWLPF